MPEARFHANWNHFTKLLVRESIAELDNIVRSFLQGQPRREVSSDGLSWIFGTSLVLPVHTIQVPFGDNSTRASSLTSNVAPIGGLHLGDISLLLHDYLCTREDLESMEQGDVDNRSGALNKKVLRASVRSSEDPIAKLFEKVFDEGSLLLLFIKRGFVHCACIEENLPTAFAGAQSFQLPKGEVLLAQACNARDLGTDLMLRPEVGYFTDGNYNPRDQNLRVVIEREVLISISRYSSLEPVSAVMDYENYLDPSIHEDGHYKYYEVEFVVPFPNSVSIKRQLHALQQSIHFSDSLGIGKCYKYAQSQASQASSNARLGPMRYKKSLLVAPAGKASCLVLIACLNLRKQK